jgi:hypothetical protein
MCLKRLFIILLIGALLAGCSATPPRSGRVSHDPLLDRGNGVLVMLDVCIQQDALGDADDYFVISESRKGAQALLNASRKYLVDNNISVTAEIIPFVCGARHDANDMPQKIANHRNGTVNNARQPFDTTETIKADPVYADALSKASTYIFQYVMTKALKANESSRQSVDPEPAVLVTDEEFRAAVALIAERTNVSSIFYIGVAGTSITSGKVAAQHIGRVIIGMATGLATGGLGTNFGLIFIPGYQIDGRIMVAALVDPQSSQLTWSNSVRAGGDPAEPEVVANTDALALLLRGLMFQSVHTRPGQ